MHRQYDIVTHCGLQFEKSLVVRTDVVILTARRRSAEITDKIETRTCNINAVDTSFVGLARRLRDMPTAFRNVPRKAKAKPVVGKSDKNVVLKSVKTVRNIEFLYLGCILRQLPVN